MTAPTVAPREVYARLDGVLVWMAESTFWRLKKEGRDVWARDVRVVGVKLIRGPR